MSVSETGYDPLEVEKVIDDAYRFAEDNAEYQEPLEEAIEMVESMPYSVNEDGTYTEDHMVETIEGLNELDNLQRQMTRDGNVELADEVRGLEDYLENHVLRPVRENGKLQN
ncbi:hypothetical protein [Candidatus Nanohalovita haloferacivicina]|uniref:hypothetical protein n=1 Tax=Candidatus Nanohalovita haloferacivicina TaxID=2978046 RepID=UPI00325FCC8D|nr:hypothetical protein HBNXNv_0606 [Candidatus Nanohalobia archaeon BNXNv]